MAACGVVRVYELDAAPVVQTPIVNLLLPALSWPKGSCR
jgi:hypothetical protein